MSLPLPRQNETKDEFIARCLAELSESNEYASDEQRLAVAENIWENPNAISDDNLRDETPTADAKGSKDDNKIVRKSIVLETKYEDGQIEAILTKQVVDRDGEVIDINGLDISEFVRNPIMLWNHRMTSADIEDVMGHWENIRKTVDKDGVPCIMATPNFAEHPKAQYLKRLVERGSVPAISIGFAIRGYDSSTMTVTEAELYEASWVAVQSNTESRRIKGLQTEEQMIESTYKKLATYEDIHPRVKNYRKLFMSKSLLDLLKYEKTGNELLDIKNIFNLITEKLTETPKATETPKKGLTREDVEMIGELVKREFKKQIGEKGGL